MATAGGEESAAPRLALAGGGASCATLLSIVSGSLLPLLGTAASAPLRLVCREFDLAIRSFPWEDRVTVVRGRLAGWRACFPRARAINVRGTAISDPEFAHLAGLKEVNMAHCANATDAAFEHLRGLHALDMSYCRQEGITDAALAPLQGLKRLVMSGCSQATLTDAALAPLAPALQSLTIDRCTQLSDAFFVPCPRLRHLSMRWCAQEGISDAALAKLGAIQFLDISHCRQPTITDAGLYELRRNLEELRMVGCYQSSITGAVFVHLRRLRHLDMRICRGSARAGARAAGLLLQEA